MTLIVQSYFDTLLRYVLSVTFCAAVVMKVMNQKTLVKRRWSYKVRRTLYILTLSEFARHEFTNLWLETFSWTLPVTLSLYLTGIRLGPKQARRVNDSTASLSLAERWTITEIRRQSNSVLTWANVNWSNDLLISKRLPFRQIKWTECKKRKRNSQKFNF